MISINLQDLIIYVIVGINLFINLISFIVSLVARSKSNKALDAENSVDYVALRSNLTQLSSAIMSLLPNSKTGVSTNNDKGDTNG